MQSTKVAVCGNTASRVPHVPSPGRGFPLQSGGLARRSVLTWPIGGSRACRARPRAALPHTREHRTHYSILHVHIHIHMNCMMGNPGLRGPWRTMGEARRTQLAWSGALPVWQPGFLGEVPLPLPRVSSWGPGWHGAANPPLYPSGLGTAPRGHPPDALVSSVARVLTNET